jgi:serine/threonine protein kinase
MLHGVMDKQFENEAYHLMRLKHPNIVLLVGWCSEKSERLLCLKYMPKGNLRQYLSGITIQYRHIVRVHFLLFETVACVV